MSRQTLRLPLPPPAKRPRVLIDQHAPGSAAAPPADTITTTAAAAAASAPVRPPASSSLFGDDATEDPPQAALPNDVLVTLQLLKSRFPAEVR